jgi:hypothetical protein
MLLQISRYLDARYTANLVPNSAHILRFTLCELWSRTYTMHLQIRIFRLQYSSERICAATGDISTIQHALYCKLWAKFSAYPPVCAMWTVLPDIYKVFTAPHILASIFSCRYLRCKCRYHMNSMRVIPQTRWKIQRTTSSLRHMNCGPGHIQGIDSSAYSYFNIRLNVSALLL